MDKLNYLFRNVDVAKTKITTLEYQVAKKADVEHVQTINQCLNEDYATREEVDAMIDSSLNSLKNFFHIFDKRTPKKYNLIWNFYRRIVYGLSRYYFQGY
jgi:pyrroloquinoline quinone (PQQ) biosynthesis protein C